MKNQQIKRGKNSQQSNLGLPQVKRDEEDFLICPECECSFFEQVAVNRYQRVHSVILGQRVPSTNRNPFYLLKCISCGQLVEPDYQMSADPLQSRYGQLLKEYEK